MHDGRTCEKPVLYRHINANFCRAHLLVWFREYKGLEAAMELRRYWQTLDGGPVSLGDVLEGEP
jgi:hypothetical protein